MIPSYENFKDFKDAGEKILEYRGGPTCLNN